MTFGRPSCFLWEMGGHKTLRALTSAYDPKQTSSGRGVTSAFSNKADIIVRQRDFQF
jgi:hypothetical protein